MERILAKKNKRKLYKLQNSKKEDQIHRDEYKKEKLGRIWGENGKDSKGNQKSFFRVLK